MSCLFRHRFGSCIDIQGGDTGVLSFTAYLGLFFCFVIFALFVVSFVIPFVFFFLGHIFYNAIMVLGVQELHAQDIIVILPLGKLFYT